MQRQRGIFDTFPETVDLNQEPNYNNRGIDESDECNISLSPTERRLLSDDLSGELNFSRLNATDHHNSRSFSSWDVGESSSRPNLQDSVVNDGLKLEQNWSSPFGTHDSRFKERQIDSSDGQPRDGFGGTRVVNGSTRILGSSSNHIPMDVDLNLAYGGNSNNDGGTSECGTDSSFGNWGLSCKRKALEGSSREFIASGSSSYFPETENIVWHTRPNGNNGSTSLTGSSPPMLNSQEQINSITRVNIPSPGRFSNGSSSHQPSRRLLHNGFLDQTSKRPISASVNPNHPLNLHLPRNLLPFPWGDNVNLNSRNGSSSSSELSPEIGSGNNERLNLVQDSADWSLASGWGSLNGANASSNAVWMPNFNSTTHGSQRLPEFSPWTLFPSSEAESVGHRGPFSPFRMGSSSNSAENGISAGLNSQGVIIDLFLRPTPLMEVPNDEWQAFTADIEGRHMLVSEVHRG